MDEIFVKQLNVIHYDKLFQANEAVIASAQQPLVIIADFETDDESATGAAIIHNKHVQIRVLPFKYEHVEKEVLPFKEKVKFFKKEVRNVLNTPAEVVVVPEDVDVIAEVVVDFFDDVDGFTDEFAEFMDGFNNKPLTGYENNIIGFFSDNYVGLTQHELDEFILGING